MPHKHRETERAPDYRFESEPADEWQAAYGRGGPVRSDEPERDYFFEQTAAPGPIRARERERAGGETRPTRSSERMNWRAAGAQDYPGGNLDDAIRDVPGDALAGSHRGKGPRGYRPSDERLREKVCERLTDDPFIDATDISVSVANGEITLSGSVETRRMKYGVEDLVAEIPGVSAVHNSIQARAPS